MSETVALTTGREHWCHSKCVQCLEHDFYYGAPFGHRSLEVRHATSRSKQAKLKQELQPVQQADPPE